MSETSLPNMDNHMQIDTSKATKFILGLIIIIALAIVLYQSVAIVEAGHRGVQLHWGAVISQPPLSEGFNFITPFADSVIVVETRTLKFVVGSTAASQDLQTVTTEITVNYRPDPEKVTILYKTVGLTYQDRVIVPAVEESVKQVTAKYNAEELITKRAQVKTDIELTITKRLNEYNIITDGISITDFQFSRLFASAIEAKVEAEQKALKAENDLLRIEVEAKQNVAQSVGTAQANIERAVGEAEAIAIINKALAENPEYLTWLKIQKWDGVLPLVTSDDATPFIHIPTK